MEYCSKPGILNLTTQSAKLTGKGDTDKCW